MNDAVSAPNVLPLRLRELYAQKRLIVIGGTGFLGKVWWSLLLDRLPVIDKLYLVVRPKPTMSSTERFWKEIAPHPSLKPLQDRHGAEYRAFLESKVVPVDGDITQPYCGISAALRRELEGTIDAVVNASGIVNFQPPLDVALEVNAFGAQTVVDLARDLGGVAVVHTSTCYVAGYRPGIVEESNPLEHPFPFAGKLERAHWDADREIAECLDIIKQAKQRAGDAFRQSSFLDQAKKNLLERGEPCSGAVLDEEIERVRRRFVEAQLSQLGQERAQFWGWPNTYTYTKSIGEQIIARSGLAFTIVRPAIIESCVDYPCAGWNEGVNTSAPIIYAIRQGQQQLPGDAVRLDLIPCDLVASGMILALAELLEGTAKPVYQYGTSDSNPVTMSRVYELSGLHKRKLYKKTGLGGPVSSFLQAHLEGALLTPQAFESYGPRRVAAVAKGVAGWLENLPEGGLSLSLEPAAVSLRAFARKQENIARVVGQFIPFTAELDYEFRCDNTRAAFARLASDERSLLYWAPEEIDWREYFLQTHIPGLDKWVFPELEAKLRKPVRALRHHETLVHLLREMAERHDLGVALQDATDAGLTRISFRDWYNLAQACATRVKRHQIGANGAVALLAESQANWAIALFGILIAGGRAVLLDPRRSQRELAECARQAGARLVIHDTGMSHAAHRLGAPGNELPCLDLGAACAPLDGTEFTPEEVDPRQVAIIAYTRGTTQSPREVQLSHEHVVRLLAAVAPLFPVSQRDRILNVQPLVRANELVCGLLLPLSRGARVVFTAKRDIPHLIGLFRTAHITAAVGGPSFWETLTDALCASSGANPLRRRWLRLGLDASIKLKRSIGIEAGPLLLSAIHDQLGGHVRLFINTGGSVSELTRKTLMGLGLPMADCYGVGEAGPLAIAPVGVRRARNQVGSAIPGVELGIDDPDSTGLGEVIARGATVPRTADPEGSGWLKTGDLGRLDERGRLTVVARREDAVRMPDGRWLCIDQWAHALASLELIAEAALVASASGPASATLLVVPRRLIPPAELESQKHQLMSSIAARLGNVSPTYPLPNVRIFNAPLPRTPDGELDRRALFEALGQEDRRADKSPSVRDAPAPGASGVPSKRVGSQLEPLWELAQRWTQRGTRRVRPVRFTDN